MKKFVLFFYAIFYLFFAFSLEASINNHPTGQVTLEKGTLEKGTPGEGASGKSLPNRLGMLVTVGDGYDLQRGLPVNYYWKNSLSQQLFYPEELLYEGIITIIGFYYLFEDQPTSPQMNIWLGETDLNDLTAGNIPSSELVLVYSGEIPDYEIGEGELFIDLQNLYIYNGGNLVLLVERPMDTQYWSNLDEFYSTLDNDHSNRSWQMHSDIVDFDPTEVYSNGINNDFFSNTTFCIHQGGSVSGCVSDNMGIPLEGVTIEVEIPLFQGITDENGYYILPHVFSGYRDVTFSKPGYETVIEFDVEIEELVNTLLNITLEPLSQISIGTDNTTTHNLPYYYWFKNSLSEVIYMAEEIAEQGITAGLLTAIGYHYTQNLTLPNQNIKVWIGETDLESPPENWIVADELTLVYDGIMELPDIEGELNLPFDSPFPYTGRNLVVLVQRPWHYAYGGNLWFYYSETVDYPNRALIIYSDVTEFDPNAPPTSSLYFSRIPNTSIYYSTENCGSLDGIVRDENDNFLEDAEVNLLGTNISVFTNIEGYYSFPALSTGIYSFEVSKAGYTSVIVCDLEIENGENIQQDFILEPDTDLEPNEYNTINSPIFLENHPNPFNPSGAGRGPTTTISFSIEQNEQYELSIYNLKGQKIKDFPPSSCHAELYPLGRTVEVRGKRRYSVTWNGTDDNNNPVSSGVYFAVLKLDDQIITSRKMLLMK